MMRLDKFLAEMGVGSRQEVKKYIRKGMVCVNGETAAGPEQKIRETEDLVTFQGEQVAYAAYEYYMLNKPAGVVSATTDARDTTAVDLIREKKRKDLFPAGRLDKDTEGLLLITNDGALAHRLLSPSRHVDKTYFVQVDGLVTEELAQTFAAGIDIGENGQTEMTRPAKLEIQRSGEISEVFQAAGMRVIYLKRLTMGSLKLDPALKPGEYRPLTREELKNVTDENAGRH